MLSKGQIKKYGSLGSKKQRQKYGLFLVEGKKSIQLLQNSDFILDSLFFKDEITLSNDIVSKAMHVVEHCGESLSKISSFDSLPNCIAAVKLPSVPPVLSLKSNGVTLFLDDIQDPGNLGTIIRTAVWYGYRQIVLSNGCVDVFNPKTIQATMGAFVHMNFEYVQKESWFEANVKHEIPVYGAFLNGKSVHTIDFPQDLVVVIGNEGHGISEGVARFVTQKIHIPGSEFIESLNAAVASAILLDNIFRVQQHGMY